MIDESDARLARWRRDLHRHPELGFLEYRTAALLCSQLEQLPGVQLRVGRDVMDPGACLDVPAAEMHVQAREDALSRGASAQWVARFGEGLTGVVADWRCGEGGPVVAFRFDMDALPVEETRDEQHRPRNQGFASELGGRMHACGHDAHTAMGLGLAHLMPALASGLNGTVRLIFQPAEEGCRGAKSMVAAGVVSDVDWLICGHIGVSVKRVGQIACGAAGLLATTKYRVRFKGERAHAGLEPHKGRNALLAAATAAVQLHALPRHDDGETRVNVGMLSAGTAMNIVAAEAELKFEVRGATTQINRYMADQAERVVMAVAAMFDVGVRLDILAEAAGIACDSELLSVVREAAQVSPRVTEVFDVVSVSGSDDATLLMEAVQKRGGRATYALIGSPTPAGHHQDSFDLDDAAMGVGVELYANIIRRLLSRHG